MTTVRKTSSVTEQQTDRIQSRAAADDYPNNSECNQDSNRHERALIGELEAIRKSLLEGESSGLPQPFDAEAFKTRMLNVLG